MTARTILVTGATDGIGKETARVLIERGHQVIVHGRSRESAAKAAHELGAQRSVAADFGVLAEVRRLGAELASEPTLDTLINNAGVLMKKQQRTVDGHEVTFQVNHLAPFLLTHLVLPGLRRHPRARVVFVASGVHHTGRIDFDDLELANSWTGYDAYAASKLMNVLTANEIARRVPEVACNSLHPGVIATKLLRVGFGGGGLPVGSGAGTSVLLAVGDEVEGMTGRYFSDEREAQSSRAAQDLTLARRLYERTCELTGAQPL
jgi:NAD(P)-dependent dehydrogenase (short-subunit alcohol dehydrogenase family)